MGAVHSFVKCSSESSNLHKSKIDSSRLKINQTRLILLLVNSGLQNIFGWNDTIRVIIVNVLNVFVFTLELNGVHSGHFLYYILNLNNLYEIGELSYEQVTKFIILFLANFSLSFGSEDLKRMISSLTFSWINPVIRLKCTQNAITAEDVEDLDLPQLQLEPEVSNAKLMKHFESNKNISKALIYTFFKPFMGILMINCLETFVALVQPYLLKELISFFNDYDPKKNSPPMHKGLLISFLIFCNSLIISNLYNQFFIKLYKLGLLLKSAMTCLIYSKTLKINHKVSSQYNNGFVLSLISLDVSRVQALSQILHLLVNIPIKLVITSFLLYKMLGPVIVYALSVIMVSFIPLCCFLVLKLKKLNALQISKKNTRINKINEYLNSIKLIKFHNWEHFLIERIEVLRSKELKNLFQIFKVIALNQFFCYLIPLSLAFITFAYTKDSISTEVVFPALSLFNILTNPLIEIPNTLNTLLEAKVSLARIQEYLDCEEIDATEKHHVETHIEPKVVLKDCSFSWKRSENGTRQPALKNISLNISSQSFVCIIGSVGSGKTTLINALLGEIPMVGSQTFDSFVRQGSVAYSSQTPWLIDSSVRDNIVFGSPFDAEFYNEVLQACELTEDIKNWDFGDLTCVGEKGMSLSGGQKARISLARAVYSKAQIYLFDDILSAVDTKVARKLVKNVFQGLIKDKLRVMTTNNLDVLSESDQVIYLSNNCIFEQSSLENSTLIYNLYKESISTIDCDTTEDIEQKQELSKGQMSESGSEQSSLSVSSFSTKTSVSSANTLDEKTSLLTSVTSNYSTFEKLPSKQLSKWRNYSTYVNACSTFGVLFFVSLLILTETFQFITNYLLKNLASSYNLYLIFGIFTSSLIFFKIFALYRFCSLNASKKFHNDMTQAVFHSSITFFDNTPVGTILNRFSNDINKVDESLPKTFAKLLTSISKAVFTLSLIVYHLPLFVVPMLMLGSIYYYYQNFYILLSKDLKKLGTTSRNPVLNHFQESLFGLETIRAFKKESYCQDKNLKKVKLNLKTLYLFRCVTRWLSFRLQFIGAMIIFSTSLLALVSFRNPLANGLIGLIMNYTMEITEVLNNIVKSFVDIETNIVCVDRIDELRCLQKEKYHGSTDECPNGDIKFENFSACYRDSFQPVLQNINLKISKNEKVGIVGRTGAGKSSLALSIYRLIDNSYGGISFNGVDISAMDLNNLRSKLSIIPQDCLLVEGTIAENLDPLNIYTTAKLMSVLELSRVTEFIVSDDILNFQVMENGKNLSLGQKQLLCLARVLLNDNEVLILDEATAAIDLHTDKVIQRTIRHNFKNRTILTIAHRINTVLDCDKIMVLDHGKVIEFDTPTNLLNQKGTFYELYCESKHDYISS